MSPMRYSVIVPVYNRPDEIDELLLSLTKLSYKSFEVIIVEDGSDKSSEKVVEKYRDKLALRYFKKENSGQGFSRNYGFERAKGDYFVVFDSDCIIPPHYFEPVNKKIETNGIDCWGGPDRAHDSFNNIQKAINYSMTSFFTTGGTRGKKQHIGTYHPRSFNMGISREVYNKTEGYVITRMGEDLEFSIRIQKMGFRTELIEDAFVYHKRRTDFIQFFKQLHFFGRARINLARYHSGQIKLVHIFPLIFFIGILLTVFALILSIPVISQLYILYFFYAFVIFFDCIRIEKNLVTGLFSVAAGFIQLSAYGIGFATEALRKSE